MNWIREVKVVVALIVCAALVLGCNESSRPNIVATNPDDHGEFAPNLPAGSATIVAPAAQVATPNIPQLAWPTTAGKGITGYRFGDPWAFAKGCDGYLKRHAGIDIGTKKGDPVFAAEAGVVRYVGFNAQWKGYAVIEHTVGSLKYTTVYWHIVSTTSVGTSVSRGAQIGTVADLGANTHLHFGVRAQPYDAISVRGALPATKPCSGDPAFTGGFVDPSLLSKP